MLKKFVFILLLIGVITYFVSAWIRSLPDIISIPDPGIAINVENGEKLFWGKARCHVCHRIGERGYALRGPNLGEGNEGRIMPIRAQERASALGLGSGVQYLVQSIAEPGAYVVPGYNDEMPKAFTAPISLFPSEIKAIICYLESLDGDTSCTDITLPPDLLATYQRADENIDVVIAGDPAAGRRLFFDLQGPAACAACHLAINADGQPEGSSIGPDLRAIAGFRTPRHILLKIVKPDSNIVSNYEAALIKTELNQYIVGIIKQETKDSILLMNRNKTNIVLDKENILSITPQNVSMMPGNYSDLLSEKQVYDLLAYLLTLTGGN